MARAGCSSLSSKHGAHVDTPGDVGVRVTSSRASCKLAVSKPAAKASGQQNQWQRPCLDMGVPWLSVSEPGWHPIGPLEGSAYKGASVVLVASIKLQSPPAVDCSLRSERTPRAGDRGGARGSTAKASPCDATSRLASQTVAERHAPGARPTSAETPRRRRRAPEVVAAHQNQAPALGAKRRAGATARSGTGLSSAARRAYRHHGVCTPHRTTSTTAPCRKRTRWTVRQ